MIAAIAVLLALLLIPLSGGSIRRLAHLKLPHELPILLLFVLQGIARGRIPFTVTERGGVVVWGLIGVALLVMLWGSRSLVGMPLVMIGMGLNLLVVLLNGGMPAVHPSVVANGGGRAFYHLASAMDVAVALGDVVPLGASFLVSLGDVLMLCGMTAVLVSASSNAGPTAVGEG